MQHRPLLSVMASAFLAGEQRIAQAVTRGGRVLGKVRRWLAPLADRYLKFIDGRTRPRHRDVVQFLSKDASFSRVLRNRLHQPVIADWVTEPHTMQPVVAAKNWNLPSIESTAELAHWLQLTSGELEWFADLKKLTCATRADAKLRHYRYRLLTKKSGNIRLIEAPKPRLKEIQQRILHSILEKIPPHPAAHGFLKGRSIQTFASSHVGQRVVIRMDLQDFFPTISSARIQTAFRTMGYPEAVANRLGGICTNATPLDVWKAHDTDPLLIQAARELHKRRHLPQGAPTSPALANLCAYRLDCRLAGLAKAVNAQYTRYADDLVFSGNEAFERGAERFSIHVAAILMEEGFHVNHRKTRIMRQGVRQHLVGLVANQKVNVIRSDFDRLKAILNNCVHLGPQGQNREAHPNFRMHIEGRVRFVEQINPQKGQRLRTIFDKIQWT